MLSKILKNSACSQMIPTGFIKLPFQITPAYAFSVHNYMKTYSPQQVSHHHGRVRVDQNSNLFKSEEKLQQFITKQSNRFSKQSERWADRTKSYLEIVNSRRDERNQSSGEIYSNYQYYTTAAWYEGREYTQVWRTPLAGGKAELVLDIMNYSSIRRYHKTVQLVRTVFSQCGNYIAFGVDLHNNQQVCFMIKNIAKNYLVGIKGWEDSKMKGVDNLVFAGNNSIIYTKVINFRPSQVWYHNLVTGQAYMIYEQKDGQFYLDISMAKDNKHAIVNSNSKETSKIYTIDVSQVETQDRKYALKQIVGCKSNTKTYVNHNGKHFVIWKDSVQGSEILLRDQKGKQIMVHKLDASQPQSIKDIDIFDKYIVLYIRNIVSPVVRVIELNSDIVISTYDLQLPYEFGSVHPGANPMCKTDTFLFYLNNIFVYNEGYEYNFKTKKIIIKEPFKMTGPRFNPNDYIVSLHQVPAQDGEHIPLTTIVSKKQSNKRNKMLVHCYGYYGLSYEIAFNNTYWAALENGWSMAYAHVRGGGEKGVKWHKQATKGLRSRNWTDLEDCVAYLIQKGYTHPNILVLSSHSAGSITIWNIINRNPHLFKAVVMNYPFLDVLGLLLDSSQPLTQSDYPQFGNPSQNLQTYNQIESYSPYENIEEEKKYPFIYLVGGTKDYRCPVQQVAKFTKRYRQVRKFQEGKERYNQIGEKGLLVKINEGSHEGLADLGDQLRDGCELLACLDYVIEEASVDVSLAK